MHLKCQLFNWIFNFIEKTIINLIALKYIINLPSLDKNILVRIKKIGQTREMLINTANKYIYCYDYVNRYLSLVVYHV